MSTTVEQLENVLRDLQKVLAQLPTDIITPNRDDDRIEASPETSNTELHSLLIQWVKDHELDDARSLRIRDAFILLLAHGERQSQRESRNASADKESLYFSTAQGKIRGQIGANWRDEIMSLSGDKARIKQEIESLWQSTESTTVIILYQAGPLGYPLQCENKIAPGRIIWAQSCYSSQEGRMLMEFSGLAVLSSWLARGSNIESIFIHRFKDRWNNDYETNSGHLNIYPNQDVYMEYSLRHFRHYIPGDILSRDNGECVYVGIVLEREHGKIHDSKHDIGFEEERMSLSLTMIQSSSTFAYVLLVVSDMALETRPSKEIWQAHGINPCGKAIGIAQFQVMICIFSAKWEETWTRTLDSIDETIRVKLNDTLDKVMWDGLMFDESFQLSKKYFTVLQLFRIISDFVDESVRDQKSIRRKWLEDKTRFRLNLSRDELASIERNWDTVISSMEMRAGRLLDRINRNTEAVKSLRDGLFNATSLREANKGMALNRAIYVFTLVTVFFTPLGFIAAF
ncbi:hypothetical protein M426DRAFT_9921 [Hypoxylon sp. CI-4A]|nr:hypothetical protein M426DRAFT_9921 [Hypoxylon sp. CI-4A]